MTYSSPTSAAKTLRVAAPPVETPWSSAALTIERCSSTGRAQARGWAQPALTLPNSTEPQRKEEAVRVKERTGADPYTSELQNEASWKKRQGEKQTWAIEKLSSVSQELKMAAASTLTLFLSRLTPFPLCPTGRVTVNTLQKRGQSTPTVVYHFLISPLVMVWL